MLPPTTLPPLHDRPQCSHITMVSCGALQRAKTSFILYNDCIAAGERPCLSALDAQRGAGPRSTLSAVVGTATSLASGLWGVARTAREQVAHGPSALTQGELVLGV